MFRNMPDSAKGIWCMIAGTLLLTSQDAITKWMTAKYHVGEILFYRGIFAFVPIVVLVVVSRNLSLLSTKSLWTTLLRAFLGTATSIFVVLSFIHLPLATALAIIFLSPIMLTALSVPLLGERVGRQRWIAVFIGFGGVLLIVQPGIGGDWAYFAIPLFTALLSTFRDIVTRGMKGGDSSVSILFYSMIVALIAGAGSLPITGTQLPNLSDLVLFAAGGTMVGLAHLLQIQALLFASAATVSPFKYLSLVYAAVIGYAIWGDIPDGWKITGAALIVGAGLFILHRERRLGSA
ncbi:MAG: hypothetical protein CMM58_05195 [Rhodospirillaceae bacterium]|nr:hypothetical protein [Rhodospirillaceae bacterium]|tara:strand:+ start:287 stop:1162 length:876 start_codon:yes stop_codon:yes gene_type:complete